MVRSARKRVGSSGASFAMMISCQTAGLIWKPPSCTPVFRARVFRCTVAFEQPVPKKYQLAYVHSQGFSDLLGSSHKFEGILIRSCMDTATAATKRVVEHKGSAGRGRLFLRLSAELSVRCLYGTWQEVYGKMPGTQKHRGWASSIVTLLAGFLG